MHTLNKSENKDEDENEGGDYLDKQAYQRCLNDQQNNMSSGSHIEYLSRAFANFPNCNGIALADGFRP